MIRKLNRILLAVGLLLTSAMSANAYIPPDDHFLCDFPMDLAVYRYARWYPYELPLKVYIPAIPYKTPNPNMYYPVLQQAFAAWQNVIPQFNFQFVDSPQQAHIVIDWVEHFPDSESAWGKALLPQPYMDAKNKLRHKSQVHLALKSQPGTGMTAEGAFFSAEELLAIATHEVGHALGLNHSRNQEDIMSAYLFRFTADSQWGLTQRDAATLRYLYSLPAKLEMSPCNG